jgi:hypothetical protein
MVVVADMCQQFAPVSLAGWLERVVLKREGSDMPRLMGLIGNSRQCWATVAVVAKLLSTETCASRSSQGVGYGQRFPLVMKLLQTH